MIWQKPGDVVVLPYEIGGYRIFHRGSGKSFKLSRGQAQAWFDGNLAGLGNAANEMREVGIVEEIPEPTYSPHKLDDLLPSVSPRWVRYYSESPELTILFNTRSMSENNPLLVLGPYGSVIWRCIINAAKIGEIRVRVMHLFGADEVLPFLARLMRLGFLVPMEQVMRLSFAEQKIIKAFNAPDIQFMIPHSLIPWYCLWEVTTICDTRCQICYLQEFKNPGPQGNDLDEIIDQLDRAGIFYVTLLGGEALLRHDLEEIVARLRNANIFVKLITNGLGLTRERAAGLAKAGLNHIEISFDGLTNISHEQSRAPDTFIKAEQSLRIAKENGIPRVGMVFTLHTHNVDDLPDLPEFMQKHGISECYISLFRKMGLLGSRSSINSISTDQLSNAQKLMVSWKGSYPELTISLLPICTCGRTSVVIGADLALRPCPFSYESAVGNLRDDSFSNLWARMGDSALAGVLWCPSL